MIGCLRTRVRKQPIIMLYFESENELKFYNLEARLLCFVCLSGVSWLLCALPRDAMGLSAVCDCGIS